MSGGYLLAYRYFFPETERFLRVSLTGETVQLSQYRTPSVAAVFGEGTRAKLVAVDYDSTLVQPQHSLWTLTEIGMVITPGEPLVTCALAPGERLEGVVWDAAFGRMHIAQFVRQSEAEPSACTVTAMSYRDQQVFPLPSWQLSPFAVVDNTLPFRLAIGPDNKDVLAYATRDGSETWEIRVLLLDSLGQPDTLLQTFSLPENLPPKSMALYTGDSTVYLLVTDIDGAEEPHGGVYLAVFDLPRDSTPPPPPETAGQLPPAPREFQLRAYPNPFNSAVRIALRHPPALRSHSASSTCSGGAWRIFQGTRKPSRGAKLYGMRRPFPQVSIWCAPQMAGPRRYRKFYC